MLQDVIHKSTQQLFCCRCPDDLPPLKTQVPPPLPPRPKNLVLPSLPREPTTMMISRRRRCSRKSVIALAVTGVVMLLVVVAVVAVVLTTKLPGTVNI